MPNTEVLQWAERGGFAFAFFALAWWVSKRIDRSETKLDTLELYIRTELMSLSTRCATALENVYDYMKGK